MDTMNLHVIMSSRGGIGKSALAASLHQGLRHAGRNVLGFDFDQLHHTYSRYNGLEVQNADFVTEDGIDLDASAFDDSLETVARTRGFDDVIVDLGTFNHHRFLYLAEDGFFDYFEDEGFTVVFHSLVAGGTMLVDSFSDVEQIGVRVPEKHPVYLWHNAFFGNLGDSESLEQTIFYMKCGSRFAKCLTLPVCPDPFFFHGGPQCFTAYRTFDDCMKSSNILTRKRAAKSFETLCRNIESAAYFEN